MLIEKGGVIRSSTEHWGWGGRLRPLVVIDGLSWTTDVHRWLTSGSSDGGTTRGMWEEMGLTGGAMTAAGSEWRTWG